MAWFDPHQVQYLSETTEKYPPIDKNFQFPERGIHEGVDSVIDEFILNEKKYYDTLVVFMNNYVAEVEVISRKKVGQDAADALGLTQNQVDYIFRHNLLKVVEAVEKFLVSLEILSLVPTEAKVRGGRAAVLADVVSLSGNHLVQVYAPYNAAYKLIKRILEDSALKLLSQPKRNSALGAMKHLNFLEIWQEVSQSKLLLKRATIDAILINPIRR